jgi:hypothetical protein
MRRFGLVCCFHQGIIPPSDRYGIGQGLKAIQGGANSEKPWK